ncbi:MAG: EAL domain-containing protein [Epsilonproteobacteria bacterium]|nr:EAL domain-containing protein [Campylobacterota bacterium]
MEEKEQWRSESDRFFLFLREQVLATLCMKTPLTMTIVMVIATGFVYFIWGDFAHGWLIVWYAVVTLLAMERTYFSLKGCRATDEQTLKSRYRRFRIEAVLMALVWAIGGFLFYPEGDTIRELLVLLVMVGLAGGGAISLAIDRKIAHLYILLLLLPLVFRTLLVGDTLHFVISVMTLLFTLVYFFSIRHLGTILEKSIQQHQELDRLRSRLNQIAEQAPVGIFYFDAQYNLVDCNRMLPRLLHIDKRALLKHNLLRLKNKNAVERLKRVVEHGENVEYEGPFRTPRRGTVWISVLLSPLKGEGGANVGGIGVLQDKTAEHRALEKVEFLAYHDALTALPNRKLLEDHYRVQIAQAWREGHYSSLLFLDLERFKQINDTYGHKVGDQLLKEVAARLVKLLRQSDTVCRLGGDEFIVFLPMLSPVKEDVRAKTERVAEKIHAVFKRAVQIEEYELYTTASIGAVVIEEKEESLDEVLRKADIAMYQAKKSGKSRTVFYDEEMDAHLQRSVKIENALRHVVEKEELYLLYQPIVEVSSAEVCGAEALLRWRYEGRDIPPSEFIPIAEESKLIHRIGHWVIEQVFSTVSRARDEGVVLPGYISINVSAAQFKHPGFYDDVMRMVDRYRIEPSRIKFEITEGIVVEDSEKARELIERFEKRGIRFMVDDFGTGYSSLSYLKKFRFETIKIDRAFIRNILHDKEDGVLVRAILEIARQFESHVIAEGVESGEQVTYLQSLDAHICCQGFYFSRPVPFEKLAALMGK